jgi:hypothetical protein
MVLYKYCSRCYSLNISRDPNSNNQKCMQCGNIGIMPQDSIDKINVMKKSKDGQRYAAASQSARPLRTGSPANDCEVIRKKDDPYNDDIEEIEIPKSGDNFEDDNEEQEDELESRQSNIMKRSSQQPTPERHGLSPKSNLSAKERLKEKGGKDWDLL